MNVLFNGFITILWKGYLATLLDFAHNALYILTMTLNKASHVFVLKIILAIREVLYYTMRVSGFLHCPNVLSKKFLVICEFLYYTMPGA